MNSIGSRFKVLVTNNYVPNFALNKLRECCELTFADALNREEILSQARNVDIDALLWRSPVKLDKEVIDAAGPKLKAVAVMSSGYNHIDVDELKKRGVQVGNCPKIADDAVATFAVLLALAASRRYTEARFLMENNRWVSSSNRQWMLGQDLAGSTVGIIGLGGIGQTIVKRLKGFCVRQFLYTGPREKKEAGPLGVKYVSLDHLLRESHFVMVSCNVNSETLKMCNKQFFRKMKNTGVFVNISRGAVVNQEDLIEALEEGQIFAAGLDVMTPEPLPSDHKLLKLPNVVVTPHMATDMQYIADERARVCAQNILRALNGEQMLTPI